MESTWVVRRLRYCDDESVYAIKLTHNQYSIQNVAHVTVSSLSHVYTAK